MSVDSDVVSGVVDLYIMVSGAVSLWFLVEDSVGGERFAVVMNYFAMVEECRFFCVCVVGARVGEDSGLLFVDDLGG